MNSNQIIVDITKQDLLKAIYFILMKFNADIYHTQGTSSKADLLGGYIDRWFNKTAESLIFNKLLENKGYSISPDYFLYGNDTEKNAPDILGIEKGEKTIPFVKYNNGSWEKVEKMPRIEIKVFRNSQSLFSIRESQLMNDYYAIIQSNLQPDYLSTIFDQALYQNNFLEDFKINSAYIKSDTNKSLIEPFKLQQQEKIGTLKLIGIYTDEIMKDICLPFKEDENPYYLDKAENVSTAYGKKSTTGLIIDITGRAYYSFNKNRYLPFFIKNYDGYSLEVLRANGASLYINAPKDLVIDGKEVKKGIVKISFKKFDRSSKWNEYISTLAFIENYAIDCSSDLITLFDKIASGSNDI